MERSELENIQTKIQDFLESYSDISNVGQFDFDEEYQYDLNFSTDNRVYSGFSDDFQSNSTEVYTKLKEVLGFDADISIEDMDTYPDGTSSWRVSFYPNDEED